MDTNTRPSLNVETEDWRLSCFLDWSPKSHAETCPTCLGHGEVGGGFGSLDGPEPCPQCTGTKFVTRGPRTPKPELPKALVEHMRRAWWDFFNKENG